MESMETFLVIIAVISGVLGFAGYISGIIVAFQKSLTWGCVSLFFAPAGVIAFLAMTWRDNYISLILILQAAVVGTLFILLYQ